MRSDEERRRLLACDLKSSISSTSQRPYSLEALRDDFRPTLIKTSDGAALTIALQAPGRSLVQLNRTCVSLGPGGKHIIFHFSPLKDNTPSETNFIIAGSPSDPQVPVSFVRTVPTAPVVQASDSPQAQAFAHASHVCGLQRASGAASLGDMGELLYTSDPFLDSRESLADCWSDVVVPLGDEQVQTMQRWVPAGDHAQGCPASAPTFAAVCKCVPMKKSEVFMSWQPYACDGMFYAVFQRARPVVESAGIGLGFSA